MATPNTSVFLQLGIGAVLAFVPTVHAQVLPANEKAIYVTMVPSQVGSPIAISKAKSTSDYLFEFVTITNRSDQKITAVQFGIASRAKDKSGATKPITRWPGPIVPVNLKPGEEQIVHAMTMSHDHVEEDLRSSPAQARVAQLGVLEVWYSNGETWKSPIAPGTGFDGSDLSSN